MEGSRIGFVGILGVALALAGCSSTEPSSSAPPGAPAADQLPGPADAHAISALPDQPPPETADWIALPPLLVSASRVSLVLEEAATVGEINSLLAAVGARIVGGNPLVGALEIAVDPDRFPVGEAVDLAGGHSGVLVASFDLGGAGPDVLGPAHASPPALKNEPNSTLNQNEWEWYETTLGSSWGLKHTRAPFAWNLRNRLAKAGASWAKEPRVLVVDDGFATHGDLDMHAATEHDTPEPPGEKPCDAAHGLCVAGVINARFDKSGIEGVVPIDVRPLGLRAASSWIGDIDNLTRALAKYGTIRIVNYSRGLKYDKARPSSPCDQPNEPDCKKLGVRTRADLVKRLAERWAAALDRVAKARDLLVVCSAGNDGVNDDHTFKAVETSPCGPGGDALPNQRLRFATVEALKRPGDALQSFSNRGGTLAAPGSSVGVLVKGASGEDGFAVDSGTSFAAPLVAGAAAILWLLDETLTTAEVLDILVGSAAPSAGDSAPRLDIYGAVQELASFKPELGILRDLADLDDGTADGSLRLDAAGADVKAFSGEGALDGRGDGCVDMADLRALRDAIRLQPDGGGIDKAALDNPKRDLNGDGVVKGTSQDKWVPDEKRYARFDLNGDGKLDRDDLLALHAVWGQCRDPKTAPQLEGLGGATAAQLADLLGTTDYWLPVVPGTQTLTATGATGHVVVDGSSSSATYAGHAPITGRVACGGTARACVVRPGAWTGEEACDDVVPQPFDQWIKPKPLAPAAPLVFKTDRGTYSATSCGSAGCLGDVVFRVGASLLSYPLDGFDGPFVPSPAGGATAALGSCPKPIDCIQMVSASGLAKSYPLPNAGWLTLSSRWGEWSPDGAQLLMNGFENALLVIDRDLGLLPQLAPTIPKLGGARFGAGAWVYFTGQGAGQGDLYSAATLPFVSAEDWLLGMLGCDVTPPLPPPEQLTVATGDDYVRLLAVAPDSPNGKFLVLARQGPKEGLAVLYGPARRWIPSTTSLVTSFDWSRTGRFVAFSDPSGTYLVEVGLGIPDALPAPTQLSAASSSVAFSPASNKHLMLVGPAMGASVPVRVYDVETKTVVLDTQQEAAGASWPAWSPDGESIALVRAYSDGYVYDAGNPLAASACDGFAFQHTDIVLVGVTTKSEQRLTQPPKFPPPNNGPQFIDADGSACAQQGGKRPTNEWMPAWARTVLEPY
jgi:hypothetical protein